MRLAAAGESGDQAADDVGADGFVFVERGGSRSSRASAFFVGSSAMARVIHSRVSGSLPLAASGHERFGIRFDERRQAVPDELWQIVVVWRLLHAQSSAAASAGRSVGGSRCSVEARTSRTRPDSSMFGHFDEARQQAADRLLSAVDRGFPIDGVDRPEIGQQAQCPGTRFSSLCI